MQGTGDPRRRPDVALAVAELLRRSWDIPPNDLRGIVVWVP